MLLIFLNTQDLRSPDLLAITFCHFWDGVLVIHTALGILDLQWPHLRETILCNVDRWVVESVLQSQRANIIVKQGITACQAFQGETDWSTVCRSAAFQRCQAQTNGVWQVTTAGNCSFANTFQQSNCFIQCDSTNEASVCFWRCRKEIAACKINSETLNKCQCSPRTVEGDLSCCWSIHFEHRLYFSARWIQTVMKEFGRPLVWVIFSVID